MTRRSASIPRNHDTAERHLNLDFWQHGDLELGFERLVCRSRHHNEAGKTDLTLALNFKKPCIVVEDGGK
jgi:hypothetical protein